MKILIFGATGMLGSSLYRVLSNEKNLDVYGTCRFPQSQKYFSDIYVNGKELISGVFAEDHDSLANAYIKIKPDIVINCIGLIKQLPESKIPTKAILINSQLPHKLSDLCKTNNSRLIHISTDCVFSGDKGNYSEDDLPDAKDMYGRSKLLGEVYEPHAITLRTSMIGHELSSNRSLLDWFLSQQNEVKGYTKAVFSGLPTTELTKVIKNLIYNDKLSGLYHVAAQAINKFDLLQLIAQTYKKSIKIIQDDSLIIDRSLNATRFYQATGYVAPSWPELISNMYHFSQIKQEA